MEGEDESTADRNERPRVKWRRCAVRLSFYQHAHGFVHELDADAFENIALISFSADLNGRDAGGTSTQRRSAPMYRGTNLARDTIAL
jgi:hypothetical protein